NLDISFKTQTSLFDFGEEKSNGMKIDPFSDEVIERIKGESFYGQSKLNLTDVQIDLRKQENYLEVKRKLNDLSLVVYVDLIQKLKNMIMACMIFVYQVMCY